MAFVEPLLRTKILIPEQPKGFIERPELKSQLDERIPAHRLTLVSAQAGYGKTTMLADWAHRHKSHSAWLSLGPEENSLDRFLRYVLFAWRRIEPEVIDSQFGLLLSSQESDMRDALISFLNITSERNQELFLFLDDYHLIESAEIHDAISFWLDNLPPQLHLIISTRVQPPLPLPRYRAHSQLFELGPEELRFDQREAADFFKQRMGLEMKEWQSQELQEQLEGWVGGMQLAALGAKGGAQARILPSGSQRYLADYLSQDVFGQLAEDVQQFLLQTSIMDRFSADLCRAVTGFDNSQQLLERIERQNLFLECLDDRGEWYRYHNLFGDFLRAELADQAREDVVTLHRRAAQWYYQREMAEPAFHHAVLSEDTQLVEEIGARFIPLKISRGELKIVENWLDSVPRAWFERHPMLIIGRAAWSAVRGDFQSTMRDLKYAEDCLDQVDVEQEVQTRARLTAFYCSAACMQNDLEAARVHGARAAEELPEDDVFFHGMINGSMGDAYRGKGQWEQARRHYMEALDYGEGTDFQFLGIHAYGGLADMCLRQGNLKEAADYWRQALAISENPESWGALPLPVVGWAYIRLAEIEYEWNQLSQAEENLAAGLERADLGGDMRAMIAAELLTGRMALARGQLDVAKEAMGAARRLLKDIQLPEWEARFDRFLLDLWLAEGDLISATRWLENNFEKWADQPENETVMLGIVRVRLAKATEADTHQALEILSRIEASSMAQERHGLQLQAEALQAIARWQGRDEAAAMHSLEKALRLAQPEGYCRSFIDLGASMARLLQEAAARKVMPTQVNELLAIFEAEMDLDERRPPLTEPLTDRELEVLELMAAGLTNKEIGEQLVISPGTVKKHAANIYGKLEVGGRTEAAARARQLALLD